MVVFFSFAFAGSPVLPDQPAASSAKSTVYTQGNAVLLRAEPHKSATVLAALPLATALSKRSNNQSGEFVPVQIASVQGYVHESLVASSPPPLEKISTAIYDYCACGAHNPQNTDGYCDASAGEQDLSACTGLRPATRYCAAFPEDSECYYDFLTVRPPPQLDLRGLENRLRVTHSLNDRLGTWMLALAPESPYIRYPSLPILNASPLFGQFPAEKRVALSGDSEAASEFGTSELARENPVLEQGYLFQVQLTPGGFRFAHGETADPMGEFPDATFTLEGSKIRIEGDFEAAFYNPCTHRFSKQPLSDLYVLPAKMEIHGSFPKSFSKELSKCLKKTRETEELQERWLFGLLDQTPDRKWLNAMVDRTPTEQPLQETGSEVEAKVSLHYPKSSGWEAYFQYLHWEGNAIEGEKVFLQIHDGTQWKRLSLYTNR